MSKLLIEENAVQNYKLTSGVLQYKNKIYIGVNT
jgi:hypothetical protein